MSNNRAVAGAECIGKVVAGYATPAVAYERYVSQAHLFSRSPVAFRDSVRGQSMARNRAAPINEKRR